MESLASSMATVIPSKLLLSLLSSSSSSDDSFPSLTPSLLPSSLRHALLILLHSLLFLFRLLLSLLLSLAHSPSSSLKPRHLNPPRLPLNDPGGNAGVARALSDVLSSMARVPVWSPKYDVVRGLADRLIDDNLRHGCAPLDAVNRAALSAAFAATLRRVGDAAAAAARRKEESRRADGSMERILGGVRSRLLRWGEEEGEAGGGAEEAGGEALEKMAAELLWLAEKMEVCGVVAEAVELWGAAAELARLALAAEAGVQGAFVKVSAFLFKHMIEMEVGKAEEQRAAATRCQMNMLVSWLPLLCQARYGTNAPVLSRQERAEVAKVLEETIETLSREQQEEVLSLWLHHYTSSPHSDWPNLQSSYIRWYNNSRKLLID